MPGPQGRPDIPLAMLQGEADKKCTKPGLREPPVLFPADKTQHQELPKRLHSSQRAKWSQGPGFIQRSHHHTVLPESPGVCSVLVLRISKNRPHGWSGELTHQETEDDPKAPPVDERRQVTRGDVCWSALQLWFFHIYVCIHHPCRIIWTLSETNKSSPAHVYVHVKEWSPI